ncbi:isochorismatase family protein [Streptomyces olivaceus]|uniref:isochorismatase family protein n=1 Tax=Streptomyces TaxID=1883 RepID=UPI0033F0D2D5
MGKTALIVIDMINTYDHEDADSLIPSVESALPRATGLLERARRRGVPVIYVNDNFGEWRSHDGAEHGRPGVRQRRVVDVSGPGRDRTG